MTATLGVAAACGDDDSGDTTAPAASPPGATAPTATGSDTAGPSTGTIGATETVRTEPRSQDDADAGAALFLSAGCGGCHVLDAAGSQGQAGPNLDDADPSLEEAIAQIRNGGGGMPAYEGQLSDQQIRDVATYVVESAGGD
ncbi:MAG TPA: c-type cytochrome [Miltoncostaeaceae bacterium]|nr:c-type cytochrome [Miltoncostaeaceae bacterium]